MVGCPYHPPPCRRIVRPVKTLPLVATVIGVIAVSMAAPYILLSEVQPYALAAWRLLSVALILAPFALKPLLADLARLSAGERFKLLASGLTYGAHFAFFALAFGYTSKESVVVLIGAQPLMAMAVGRIFLGEAITRSMLGATALSLVGLGLFVWNDYSFDPGHLWGDAMVLICGLLIVISYAIGRRLRPRMKLTSYLFSLYLLGGLGCLAAALVAGNALWGFHWINWYYLGCAIIIPTLVGHSMFHYVVKYVPVFYVNLAILAEPVIAIVVMLLLRERFEVFSASELTGLQTLGGALLLAGVALGLGVARKAKGDGHEQDNRSASGGGGSDADTRQPERAGEPATAGS